MKAVYMFLLVCSCVVVKHSVAQNKADDVSKTVKLLVQAVRTSKDAQATGYFAAEEQEQFLTGSYWDKGTPDQRASFTRLFQSLFRKIAFSKMRENLKNLSSISYDKPVITGAEASLASSIFIHHPLKQQELKLKYTAVKTKTGWKVLDVAVLGSSMLVSIRDDQVQPLLKEGGWVKLLDEMQKKDAEMK